uniref:Uncharacterized protein n=1 Tax=Romanomermis culicivorax TaxID=13658 RepID=A0A915HUG2_ROMCU
MDKKAEIKEIKCSITPTKTAVPPKYQMKPARIIAATRMRQSPVAGIRTFVITREWRFLLILFRKAVPDLVSLPGLNKVQKLVSTCNDESDNNMDDSDIIK